MTQHLVHNGKLNTKDAKFKDDLVDKICEIEFNFLVISFCERIQNDTRLQRFYGSYDLKSLMTLQKELLLVAFWDVPKEDTKVLKGRLVLRHHRLWQLGFNERHFDILGQHFVDAMRDCWIDNCLLELCKISFDELRPIFKENGTTVRMADLLQDVKMHMLSLVLRDQKELRSFKKEDERLAKSEQKLKMDIHHFRRKTKIAPTMDHKRESNH